MDSDPVRTRADRTPRHPIGVVSGRTGLPQDILRMWERRYRVVVPGRTKTGRRLYSDEDLERFRLLKRLVDSGRRIGDVASLPFEELRSLAREDAAQPVAIAPRRDGAVLASARVVECLAAAEALDADRLTRALEGASMELGASAARREVMVPLLDAIGERWRDSSLRIASEHLATGVIRTLLGSAQQELNVPPSAPAVLVATPPGCRHEIGALLAAAAAAEIGWNVVYLGPDLPPEEIAAAARQRGVRAMALSVVFPPGDPGVRADLYKLRRLLGEGLSLLVGGAAAASYDDVLTEIGARRIEDLASFQEALESLG
ncbi:MAG: MerR family transcriptional regulator [bacterium]